MGMGSVGPSTGRKSCRSLKSKRLLAALLAGTCLMPFGAAAQVTGTWVGGVGMTGNQYSVGANWQLGAVPQAGDTAVFGNLANVRNLSINSSAVSVGTWQFTNTGTPPFSFSVQRALDFQGGGIVNNSSFRPTITVSNPGSLTFSNASSAGNALIMDMANVNTIFRNTSIGRQRHDHQQHQCRPVLPRLGNNRERHRRQQRRCRQFQGKRNGGCRHHQQYGRDSERRLRQFLDRQAAPPSRPRAARRCNSPTRAPAARHGSSPTQAASSISPVWRPAA